MIGEGSARVIMTSYVGVQLDLVAGSLSLSWGDRVPGIWLQGKGKAAIVVDPKGSSASLGTDVVKRMRREGRSVLLLDVFQTGAAKAQRAGDAANGSVPKLPDDADDEERADAAAGYPKFLTFNVSDDTARVQDILTAIAYLNRDHQDVELFATGDAALWSMFAAAVSSIPVSLHVENVPKLTTDADYVEHFSVSGILRAGGLPVAEKLVNGRD